jgi:lysophospholipase L1-like esterase
MTIGFVLCAGCLVDLDRDGVRELLFAGDSNTTFLSCAYPIEWQARHDPAVLRGYDDGIFGTTAHFWVDYGVLLDRLDRDQPDGVVIALGTNDLGQGIAPALVMSNLMLLYRQVLAHTLPNGAHPVAAIATVPPIYDPTGVDPVRTAAVNANIRLLNSLIRAWLPPARVVDFDSWMPAEWDPAFMWTNARGQPDGVHISCGAHEIRADLIDDLVNRIS